MTRIENVRPNRKSLATREALFRTPSPRSDMLTLRILLCDGMLQASGNTQDRDRAVVYVIANAPSQSL